MGEGRVSKLDFVTHHEAGHAAVAVYFGLRLNQVRVEQDDNSGGVSLTEEALRKRTDIQRVLIALAGSIAERHLDPSGVGPRKGPDEDEAWAFRTVVARLHSRLERRSRQNTGAHEKPSCRSLCTHRQREMASDTAARG